MCLILGASHGKDLASIHWSDSPEMLAAKHKIKELVQKWINEYNSN